MLNTTQTEITLLVYGIGALCFLAGILYEKNKHWRLHHNE